MDNLKRVGINMISGGLGFIVPMLINFISTPYVIKLLGQEAYGIQVLGNVIIGYLIVADMGLDIPITRKIAEYYTNGDENSRSKFLATTIKLYSIIGIFGMILVILLSSRLVNLLAIPESLTYQAKVVFYLTAAGFFGSIITMWGKAVLNGIHRYDITNTVSISNNLFGIVVGIVLLINGYGVIGFFSARIIGLMLSGGVYIFLIMRYIKAFSFFPIADPEVWSYLKVQVGYGFLLRVSGMIFSRMDQTIISSVLGVSMLTIYSIPVLIANTLSGLIASITHFVFPMASSKSQTHSLKEMESFFIRVSKFTTIIATLVFLPLIILGDKFIALWISEVVADQNRAILILLLVSFYINTSFTLSIITFMVGIGQLKTFTYYGVSRSILLLIGFILLIKPFGLNGAGFSYATSLVLDLAFLVFCIKRRLHFNFSRLLISAHIKPMALGLVIGVILWFLRFYVDDWITLVLASGLFVLVYGGTAWIANLFDQTEKNMVHGLMAKIGRLRNVG